MTSSVSQPPTVWALHTISGSVAQVPQHLLEHPLFGQHLVEVAPFTKSYEPALWKPTTAAEYQAPRGNSAPASSTNKTEDKK